MIELAKVKHTAAVLMKILECIRNLKILFNLLQNKKDFQVFQL